LMAEAHAAEVAMAMVEAVVRARAAGMARVAGWVARMDLETAAAAKVRVEEEVRMAGTVVTLVERVAAVAGGGSGEAARPGLLARGR